MNTRMIGFVLGRILLTEAGLLVLPTITAALYGEILWPWIASIILTAACGGALSSRKPERTALYAKDGFVTVALGMAGHVGVRSAALCTQRRYSPLCRRFF